LAGLLKAQGSVFALVSAEGGGLFENIGRYSDKGGLEIYLNGYSGDRIRVDRKNSDCIVIDRPTLSLLAPCQPSVITDLFADKQKAGRGLLSRILFVKCLSRVGARKPTSQYFDTRVSGNYRNLCYNMLSAGSGGDLVYDKDGFAVYCDFFNEIEPQLTPDIGELSNIAEWAGKLHGQMTRIAGLIHCINAYERGQDPIAIGINESEAKAAVILARYFLAHAKAVYMEQSEPPEISDARYLWGRIKSIKSLKIAKRDLIRKVQGKQDFNLDSSLDTLVERGYIRIRRSESGKAGRPSETILINPIVETIVNILTKLTLSPENADLVNKVNKFTTTLTIPLTPEAAGFRQIPDSETGDLPFN
jgi:hypothetical protein